MNRRRLFACIFAILLLLFIPAMSFANEIPQNDPDSSGNATSPPRTDYVRNESLILSYMLNEDGAVNVNERWNVYCDGVPGVFVAKLYPQVGYDISDIRITDEAGNSYVRIFGSSSDIKSNYYTSETSADGIQTFKIYTDTTDDYFVTNISYTVRGAVVNHADATTFEYTIVDGRLLTEEMPSLTVNVTTHTALEKFSDFMLNVYSNAEYETSPVNKSQTDISFRNFPAYQDVSLRVIMPLDIFGKNTVTDTDYILSDGNIVKPNYFTITPQIWTVFTPSMLFKIDFITRVNNFPGGWAGIAGILSFPGAVIILVVLYGKKSESKGKIRRPNRSDFRGRYRSRFPDELNFTTAARLLEHTKASYMDQPRYFSSILLSLYSKGYVSILSTKRGLRLRLTGKEDEYLLNEQERLMIIFLDTAVGTNHDVKMGELAEYMFRNCDKVHSLHEAFCDIFDSELMAEEMLVQDSDNILYKHFTSKMTNVSFWTYLCGMVVISAISNMMWIMGKGIGYLVMSFCIIITVVLLVLSKKLNRSITLKGEKSAYEWNAFARYINEAERMISEEELFDYDKPASLFLYAIAFNANKRALRYLNYILPWVGEDSEDTILQGTAEGQKYSVCASRLLQFLDEFENQVSDCLKLYNSEKGIFNKKKSEKRIRSYEITKANFTENEYVAP